MLSATVRGKVEDDVGAHIAHDADQCGCAAIVEMYGRASTCVPEAIKVRCGACDDMRPPSVRNKPPRQVGSDESSGACYKAGTALRRYICLMIYVQKPIPKKVSSRSAT